MRVYLCGKVRGRKWEVVKGIEGVEFLASDGSDHSEHDWGGGYFDFGNNDLKEMVWSDCLSVIKQCDLVVAYLDRTDSFGSIAEVAAASMLGKPCYLIISYLQEQEGWEDTLDALHDAYWFVSCFPGVVTVVVSGEAEASLALRRRVQLESPIEVAFYEASCPTLDLIPQYEVDGGRYRLDFAVPGVKVAVELDGHEHHSSKENRAYDAKRDRYLTAQGWTVVRFTGSEVYSDVKSCVDELRTIVKGKQKE